MTGNTYEIAGFYRDRDEALKISLSKNSDDSDIINVTLVGRIDGYNAAFFQNKLEMILEDGFRKILFCCGSLEFISSAGFGVLATYLSRVKEDKGTFVFIDVKPKVMEVFHLLGFDHLFGIAVEAYDVQRLFDECGQEIQSVFPRSFDCPSCSSRLKASKAGKFRCSKCKIIIEIDEEGVVRLC